MAQRWSTPVAAALLATTLLAGPTAASAQALSGELRIWAWDIAAGALEGLVPAFNREHPNVKVTVEDLGNLQAYDRGLAGCAAGGTGLPDIYQIENNEAEVFWQRFPDCFADLGRLGITGLDAEFPAFKLVELTADGKALAMPWDSGPVVVFYRHDLYQQAGVDPASVKSWADFAEAGRKIGEATGGKVKLATASIGSDDEWFRMLGNANGCGYFDAAGENVALASPACAETLETIKVLVDAGVIARGGWNEQIQNVKAGTVASAVYGAWYEGTIRTNAADQSGQWGVFPMPGSDGPGAANIGGSALAIPAGSANGAAAAAFLRMALGTPEGQIAMLKSHGLVPSLNAALSDPYVNEPQPFWGGQPTWRPVLDVLPRIQPMRGTQYFQEAREAMTTVLASYLDGDYESATEALEDAAEQVSGATGLPVAE